MKHYFNNEQFKSTVKANKLHRCKTVSPIDSGLQDTSRLRFKCIKQIKFRSDLI